MLNKKGFTFDRFIEDYLFRVPVIKSAQFLNVIGGNTFALKDGN